MPGRSRCGRPRAALPGPQLVDRLRRFSAIAIAAIPVLVILGFWLAWVLAGGVKGLFETNYGRLLLLKLAVSLDGMVADASGASRWVSGPEARTWVHALRAGFGGVAVGGKTAVQDDVRLTVRGAPPPRVPPPHVAPPTASPRGRRP